MKIEKFPNDDIKAESIRNTYFEFVKILLLNLDETCGEHNIHVHDTYTWIVRHTLYQSFNFFPNLLGSNASTCFIKYNAACTCMFFLKIQFIE